jgi:phospholipid transport system substrate-binding protein
MPFLIRTITQFVAALGVVLFLTPAQAVESPPTQVIQDFYATLLNVMKNAHSLGLKGRYDALKPAIDAAFDLPLMTRLSIGPQWQSLTAQEQEQLAAAFSDFSYSTYASRFDGYSGERFEVLPQTNPAAGGVIVQTRLIKSDGEPITLNYLMRQENDRWRIIDVFLSGTVSELATRRAEFTSVLRRDGPGGLLKLLRDRAAELKKA